LAERSKTRPLTSVLVKPAGPDCNLSCTYCFYLEKAKLFPHTPGHRMSIPTLEEMVRQVLIYGTAEVSFTWQGGEPTLMGLSFFEEAVEFQKRYGRGHTVGNGLQTNGILLDGEWAKFLADYGFLVGLSLDGPRHVHDHYRTSRNGRGSWATVADKARLLLDADVAVNALSVVTDVAVRFPDEIYDFHKSLGLTHMQFVPCVEPDESAPAGIAAFSAPAVEYGRFLCRVFDRWLEDFRDGRPTTSVRFFDSVFHSYAGLPPPECTLLQECGIYVVVEHNGDVYPCDFYVDSEWRLGNIAEGRLIDMLNSSLQSKFGCRKDALPEECRECPWLRLCRGGCPRNRLYCSESPLDYFCSSYRVYFEHADETMRNMAKNWKRQQAQEALQGYETSLHATRRLQGTGRNDPCPCGSGLKFKKCCMRAASMPE